MKQEHNVTVEGLGIEISTGTLAQQAGGSITIKMGETTVFVAATCATSLRPGQDFFPLTVDYREKFSAAGRFPGGYFKREARPSEKEILTSRLCDRPLRPLFPKGFMNEVQVIGMLMSADEVNEPDVLMVNGASAAMLISDAPWNGPIGCIRLGEINGEFVVNPTYEQQQESTLDLIYVGSEKEMMMIEGSADQIPEERFIEALEFSHQAIQPIIAAQKELAKLAGKEKKTFTLYKAEETYLEKCKAIVGDRMAGALTVDSRAARSIAVGALKDEATEKLEAELGEAFDADQVRLSFEELEEAAYRSTILDAGKRVDGRAAADLREISCSTDLLPRVHGSALFARGETQSVVITTLGATKDSQEMDGLSGGPTSKSFLLHYNFPPYSVGETGRFIGPGRREIGHGALAERSIVPVLPAEDDFPYAIRVVSEVMSSNGSTSMASICGGVLSLMDAGVPLIAPVAGISTGMVSNSNEAGEITDYVILTDILGAEDHFGDMDFKIAGSRDGITGFQLDLKIKGIPANIAREAVMQCREARLQILDVMEASLPAPREGVKANAPRVHQIQIDPEKIGFLIGPGGKNIRRICDVSGAQVDINEDNSGRVAIYATSQESLQRAIDEIQGSTAEIEVGKTYKGIVTGVKEFGAFVECLPGKEGLCHISELADVRVEKTEDICNIGDEILVKCVDKEQGGKVRLSRRAVLAEQQGIEYVPNTRSGGGSDRGGDRGGRGRGERSGNSRGRRRENA